MPSCYYVVRCDFPRADLLAEWDRWYVGHIELLLSVPGFLGAQRFHAPGASDGRPFLALYELSSPDVMRSGVYERARGFGGWTEHVTRWTRDLVAPPGDAELTFATSPDGRLWAAFFLGASPPEAARSIGLDHSFDAALWRPLEPGEQPSELEGFRAAAAVFTPRTEFVTRGHP